LIVPFVSSDISLSPAKRTDPSCVPCNVFEDCKTKNKPRLGCSQEVARPEEEKPKPEMPKKDTLAWFAMLTEAKRKSNPDWAWEVWKTDPAKGEWLYEGAATEQAANDLRDKFAADPERLKFQPGITFSVEPRPMIDYDPLGDEGPCETCTLPVCLDDGGDDGCRELQECIRKLCNEPEDAIPEKVLYIISCGKAKIWDKPGEGKKQKSVPAMDAYTGPLFTSSLRYINSVRYEKEAAGPWLILSDKYGLISPDTRIENYEVSPEEVCEDPDFLEMVHHQVKTNQDLSFIRIKRIVTTCGAAHQKILEIVFPGVEIYNLVKGLTQGERMKVLKDLVETPPPEETPAERLARGKAIREEVRETGKR